MRLGDVDYPVPSSPSASVRMRSNPPSDTKPEVRLRSTLHRAGLRFRKNHQLIVQGRRSRPDIVFPGARVAVFLDGCFWHHCPLHGSLPRANGSYWAAKFARNADRDEALDQALGEAGWTVVRLWEHEPLETAARHVLDVVRTSKVSEGQSLRGSKVVLPSIAKSWNSGPAKSRVPDEPQSTLGPRSQSRRAPGLLPPPTAETEGKSPWAS